MATVLNVKHTQYFNAGVLLLNLKKIRRDNIEPKLWNFAIDRSPLDFQDQDVLNAVLGNKVKLISPDGICTKITLIKLLIDRIVKRLQG